MKTQPGRAATLLGWLGWLPGTRALQESEEVQRLRAEMAVARQEWHDADQYFQAVTDPELVDHAIFLMEAARRKYRYLFRRLRQAQGLPEDQGEAEWL